MCKTDYGGGGGGGGGGKNVPKIYYFICERPLNTISKFGPSNIINLISKVAFN